MALNWRKIIVLMGCGALMSSLGACSERANQTTSEGQKPTLATSASLESEASIAKKNSTQAKGTSQINKAAAVAESKATKGTASGTKSKTTSSQSPAGKSSETASQVGNGVNKTQQNVKIAADSSMQKAALKSVAYPMAGKGKASASKIMGKDSPAVSSLSQEARKKIVADDAKANLSFVAKKQDSWYKKRDLSAQPGYEIYAKAVSCTESGRYKEAARLYAQAAQMGLAEAQYEYSVCLANGTGVKASPSESFQYLRQAAEQGYDKAQTNLGIYYRRGYGVGADAKESAHWFLKAAEQ